MSPRNPSRAPQKNTTTSTVGSFLTKAAFLGMVGGTVFGEQARAAVPSVGTSTEVSNVNTTDYDERNMIELDTGLKVFIQEDGLAGESKPMVIDPTASSPSSSELCGSGSYGNNIFDAVTSIDLASAGTVYLYVPGDWSGDNHKEVSDNSTGSDFSSCSESILSITSAVSGYTSSYDYTTGTYDYTDYNGTDNDISVDGGTDITGSDEQTAPGKCAGTDYEFYTVGEEGSAEIYVRDINDTTSDTFAIDGAYPRCDVTNNTLYFSEWDSSSGTWDLYYTTITFPAEDADGDGYDTDSDCDDTDASVYPGAPVDYTDGKDTDCDSRADTPEWTSLDVNGETIEEGSTIHTEVGETLVFSGVGKDEETLSTDLEITYDLSGDIGGDFAAPYRLVSASGDTVEFTPTEQGVIDVEVTLTDSDGNAQVLEFTIVAGVSLDDVSTTEEIEEGTIIVDGDGATTVETTGVSYNGAEIVISNGRVGFSGAPETTFVGVDPDGDVVGYALITEPNDVLDNGGWIAAGILSGGSTSSGFAPEPPSDNSEYGEYSDNDYEDSQLIMYTNNGFDIWGTNIDSTDGTLEMEESFAPTTSGDNEETIFSDKFDTDESTEEPGDTGEPDDTGYPDDTGEPDDTDEPTDDSGIPDNTNPVNNERPEDNVGCSTAPNEAPNGSGFLVSIALLGAAVTRRFKTGKSKNDKEG